MGSLKANDLDFIERFENCSFNKQCWTHEAHIRMAWIQLNRFKTFEEALSRIKAGIRRFNSSVNSIGYHETVTVAFSRLIYSRILSADPTQSWAEFAKDNSDIFSKDPPILHVHYSNEVLGDVKSKEFFVAPDRKPLPPPGLVRMATETDAEAILSIYAFYVEKTPVSFEFSVPSVADFRTRIRELLNTHPWLVFETEGKIVGYAYASKHRSREAYQWSTEVSAYVSVDFQRQGIAKILYSNLLGRLNALGYHSALAGITLPNEKSVGFHEAMGFSPIGVYRSVGFKMDKWHDVGWWQKFLRPPFEPPLDLKAIPSFGSIEGL